MAKYRHVHTTFWDDGFVLDLTPEEKYFYLYLMTNSNTTQCGIYELPYRVIEMHTGYNRETVQKLLQRFFEYGKINYNELTKEIMLTNWAKYNFINSPKVKKCIEKELLAVKHIPFVKSYVTSLELFGYSIDNVSILLNGLNEQEEPQPINDIGSIPYQYYIDTPSKEFGEKEKRKEKEKKKKRKTKTNSRR
ncbi:replication protein [Lysinibacillus sp. YS11]|uniref:replication protein n=1 Tax=Lysinibacillus sp. YS11 TaxID=2072025 RepID=UPI0018F84E0B|nr:replication protein [Lysinibacillus sp. YS11]